MIRRILAIFRARNLEFVRDRASLGWAVVMPFVLVLALGFVFSGDETDQFTVGTIGAADVAGHEFLATRYVNFVPVEDVEHAQRQIARHQLDLLVRFDVPVAYWVNPDSPRGYVTERLLLQSAPDAQRQPVSGTAIRYVDWLVPGILGMNMMFSCLFGVGYVVVRYRKNGFLKRLQATPLSAFEFITAQALSRLALTLAVQAAVFLGVKALLDITMNGSYLALLLVAFVGCSSMIALALVLAARVASEELAGGLLNLMSFPMLLLSGVFYSLEGTPDWLQSVASVLPLTQLLQAARAIMIDGAGLGGVVPELAVLGAQTIGLLIAGAALFRWRST